MTVFYIKGNYRIIGASPDGDSIRFYPERSDAFTSAGINVRANSTGGVQLRLDAIDALETHYTPPSGGQAWEQNPAFSNGAGDALLGLLGFSDVVRDDRKYVTSATPDQVPGYILTQFADKYGRAVAMAFAGQRTDEAEDGARVYLDIDELHRSTNHLLLTHGWVYPTFYSRLYFDLRDDLAATSVAARTTRAGIWAEDHTIDGFTLESREQLTQQLVLMPKLFRRLAEYLALDDSGGVDLSGFKTFLEAKADLLFTVPSGQMTHLDTLINVAGQEMVMTIPPEQVVFIEA
jgi:endonuclease YncB( thermonuclease family)